MFDQMPFAVIDLTFFGLDWPTNWHRLPVGLLDFSQKGIKQLTCFQMIGQGITIFVPSIFPPSAHRTAEINGEGQRYISSQGTFREPQNLKVRLPTSWGGSYVCLEPK